MRAQVEQIFTAIENRKGSIHLPEEAKNLFLTADDMDALISGIQEELGSFRLRAAVDPLTYILLGLAGMFVVAMPSFFSVIPAKASVALLLSQMGLAVYFYKGTALAARKRRFLAVLQDSGYPCKFWREKLEKTPQGPATAYIQHLASRTRRASGLEVAVVRYLSAEKTQNTP